MDYLESLKILGRIFPESANSHLQLNSDGWDSQVFISDQSYVYKISRLPGRNKIRREASFLKSLQPLLYGTVPGGVRYGNTVTHGASYEAMAYRYIRGYTLQEFLPQNCSNIASLAFSLIWHLFKIHSIPPENFTIHDMGMDDNLAWKKYYAKMHQNLIETVYPTINNNTSDMIEVMLQEFISNSDSFRFEPKFIHGDIDPRNILWSPETMSIAGIIDWGEARMGDPAFDYASLFFNPKIGNIALKNRIEALHGNFPGRIEFYHRFVPVYWIEYGVRNGERNLISEGVRELEKRASLQFDPQDFNFHHSK